jgi:hypothetical protein
MVTNIETIKTTIRPKSGRNSEKKSKTKPSYWITDAHVNELLLANMSDTNRGGLKIDHEYNTETMNTAEKNPHPPSLSYTKVSSFSSNRKLSHRDGSNNKTYEYQIKLENNEADATKPSRNQVNNPLTHADIQPSKLNGSKTELLRLLNDNETFLKKFQHLKPVKNETNDTIHYDPYDFESLDQEAELELRNGLYDYHNQKPKALRSRSFNIGTHQKSENVKDTTAFFQSPYIQRTKTARKHQKTNQVPHETSARKNGFSNDLEFHTQAYPPPQEKMKPKRSKSAGTSRRK